MQKIVTIRMQPELHDAINRLSHEQQISMNSFVVKTLCRECGLSPAIAETMRERLARIERENAELKQKANGDG